MATGTFFTRPPLQNRDTFQRQTGLLNQQGGTRPLKSPGTRPLTDPNAVKAQVEALLAKGEATLKGLEPRIEFLMRACQAVSLPLPGVELNGFKHPLSPKGEQIIQYMSGVLTTNQALARQVQVVTFRYQEAVKASEMAASALQQDILRPDLLEDLKLKLFYMSRVHEEFKGDPVLKQVFPPPQTVTGPGAGKPGAPMSTVDRLKAKQARQALLTKAEVLANNLAPKIEIVRMALENLEQKGLNLGAFFTPETRQARMVAMGISTKPELVDQLKQTHALFLKLQEALPEARKPDSDLEPLKAIIQPLSQLAVSCQKHAVLKDLFPLGEKELFPDQGG